MERTQPHFLIGIRWMCLFVLFTSAGFSLSAQQVSRLTLGQAYALARKNYPLIKQWDLISRTRQYSVENAAKGYLPALNLSGLATYQSAVTYFPEPGFPVFSKDQYKFYAEIDQVIYDGGQIKNQKETARVNEVIQHQSLEVDLYALYDRINQLFFGAILVDEQLNLNDLLRQDLVNGIDKARAQLNNGTAYRSSVDELSAQLLQTDQSRLELKATRKAYLDMLGLFTNRVFDERSVLQKPDVPNLTDSVSRPELLFYDYQKRAYDLQDDLLKVQLRPKVSFFIQGGLARPGLNFLSDEFAWYYIGGLKLSWNLGSLYALKNQRQLSEVGRENLDIQKQTFLFNTQISQRQGNADIDKYVELVKKDDAIVALREAVKTASSAQLENGVLSARDYITEVNAEDQARQNRIVHQMQLLQAQFSFQSVTGMASIK
jgi:outer membrane protein TolC